jgi:hypothetical protein
MQQCCDDTGTVQPFRGQYAGDCQRVSDISLAGCADLFAVMFVGEMEGALNLVNISARGIVFHGLFKFSQ